MNGARPGGPLRYNWTLDEGDVVLVLNDTSHGGGLRLHFDTPAWAQAFIDTLAHDLDAISERWGES